MTALGLPHILSPREFFRSPPTTSSSIYPSVLIPSCKSWIADLCLACRSFLHFFLPLSVAPSKKPFYLSFPFRVDSLFSSVPRYYYSCLEYHPGPAVVDSFNTLVTTGWLYLPYFIFSSVGPPRNTLASFPFFPFFQSRAHRSSA